MQFPNSAYSGYSKPEDVLRQSLLVAEKRYGERVHEVDFTVEIDKKGPIAVVYHNQELSKATVHIRAGSDDTNQQKFQLALEGFHLLSPVLRHKVTFLEEGMSQIFALSETVGLLPSDDVHYKEAHALCKSLEKACGDDIVRRLRKKQRYISRITPDEIIALCPGFPRKDAEHLCKPWPYYQ